MKAVLSFKSSGFNHLISQRNKIITLHRDRLIILENTTSKILQVYWLGKTEYLLFTNTRLNRWTDFPPPQHVHTHTHTQAITWNSHYTTDIGIPYFSSYSKFNCGFPVSIIHTDTYCSNLYQWTHLYTQTHFIWNVYKSTITSMVTVWKCRLRATNLYRHNAFLNSDLHEQSRWY